jgi:hypothetical protein
LQVLFGQHGCPVSPQAVGAQVKPPPLQATFCPHAWLQQNPLVALQTPLWQSLASSHCAPFARFATQVPPSQCAPLLHTFPEQHVCPAAPQAAVTQVKPAPVQATPLAQAWLQQKPLAALQCPLAHTPSDPHGCPF